MHEEGETTYKKCSCCVKGVLELLESLPLDNGACFPRPYSCPRRKVGNDYHRQLHKSNGPDSPGKPNLRQQLSNHGGEDEAASSASTGCDTYC
jgi:hypothetical protein